jgi:hypothetical protein
MSDGFDSAAKGAAGQEKRGLTGGLSRRRVVQGAAWSVPAIAIAAPVPAFAGISQGTITLDGTGCKLPGNSNSSYKGYAFNLNASNTTASTYYCIIIDKVTLNGVDLGAVTVYNLQSGMATFCKNLGNPFCLAPGETLDNLALLTTNAANSSNGGLEVTYRVSENVGSCSCANYGPVQTAGATIGSAPPINGASCTSFSQNEKKKCLAGAVPPPAWTPNTTYAAGDVVKLSGGAILSATNSGTSGTTEPVPPGVGSTVQDGTVLWEQV